MAELQADWEVRFVELAGGADVFIPRNRRPYWELIAFILEVATYLDVPELGRDDAVLAEIEKLEAHLRWLDRPPTRRSAGFLAAQTRSFHGPRAAAPLEGDRVDRFLAKTTRLPYLVRGLPGRDEVPRIPTEQRAQLARELVLNRARQLRDRA